MEEEGCGHVCIGTTLIEYLQDTFTSVISNLLLGSDCLETGGSNECHNKNICN
jgi:hypothetical protein